MKGSGLFLFYLIFWVCGRIYVFADTYLYVKIFQGVGLHFDLICLIAYIIHITPSSKIGEKLFWQFFLYYEISAALFYCFVQINMDQGKKALLWSQGERSSAASSIHPGLGIMQEIFIPAMIITTIWVLWKAACYYKISSQREKHGRSKTNTNT